MSQTTAADAPAFAYITAAITTPFRPEDLSVDLELLERHAHWLLSNGSLRFVMSMHLASR